MATLMILLNLSCPKTIMQNATEFPWNDHDYKTLEYCKKRCVQIYEKSPCVTFFRKFGKQDYTVLCGEKR